MKKFLLVFAIMISLPVVAAETTLNIPKSRSVEYISPDARFKYDLPDGKGFSMFKKENKSQVAGDSSEVTLREEDVKPVRKVIKKLSDDTPINTPQVNQEEIPMNYNSFPKYYDPNSMLQNQFMPMSSF